MSSSIVGDSTPFMVNIEKSPLVISVFSPRDHKFVASSGGVAIATVVLTSPKMTAISLIDVGSGECLPEFPEGGFASSDHLSQG